MAEENWWDRFTTGLGDVLAGPQQPWGTSMPGIMPAPTPAQRAGMISNTLMSLGGALSQGARQRLPLGESIATGWQAAQQGGAQRAQQQLQAMLLAGRLGEARRKNETMEMLGRTKPPPGVEPDVWRGLVATDPGKAFELYVRLFRKTAADNSVNPGRVAPDSTNGEPRPTLVPGASPPPPVPTGQNGPRKPHVLWDSRKRKLVPVP